MVFSALAGNPVDGYSFFFQVFAGIGSLSYLMLGLWFLKKILECINIRAVVIRTVLISILFGTNLLYYSLWQPVMSHVFSFFAINGFLWYTVRAMKAWNMKTVAMMGFFLGIVFLIRPTNMVVVLLIPFIAGDAGHVSQVMREIRKNPRALILLTGIFLVFAALQMAAWYWQTGRLLVWSYGGEGFNFGHPEVVKVLFSYRKGLFIYTPLSLVAIFGLIPLLFRKWLQLTSMLAFLLLATYIISSWWGWDYGDGFGLRAYIDYYGIFAILLAVVMNMSKSKAGAILMAVILTPLMALNLVQTWQYTHQVMQPNNMNSVKYHYIFMRTDSAVINCLGGMDEIPNHNISMAAPVRSFSTDLEKPVDGWSTNNIVLTSRGHSGDHAGYLDSLHQFSPGVAFRAELLGKMPASIYATGEIMVWDSVAGASNGALIVLSMDSISQGEKWWQGFKMNDIPVNTSKTWRRIKFSLMLPEIENEQGIVKVYIWNAGKKPMLVDDLRVRFYGSTSESKEN
jgi:hypothetical protein